jgi:integrase
MRAFKDFYTANFENIRSEMAELIDEDLRVMHTSSFAASNENSFRSFAVKWLNNDENGLTEVTKKKYLRLCEEYIFPVLGNTDCRRITLAHADSVTQKNLDMPLKTHADIMRVMWLTLDFASKNGLKIRVSQRNLCKVSNYGAELRILADDEIDRLVKYLKGADSVMCAGIYLALNTGIRAEELCALKRGDIDLCGKKLRVCKSATAQLYLSQKTDGYFETDTIKNFERVIFLPEFLVEFLRPVYDKIPQDCYLINGFPNKAYGAETVENKVRKIAGKCGLFDVGFSAIRDTFGTRCAENNMDATILKAIMGADNVEIYYPVKKTAEESPLEFLREAY